MQVRKFVNTTLIVVLIFMASCVQNDYSKLSTGLVWHPNVSVPLGKSHFNAANIASLNISDEVQLPEEFSFSDTISFNFVEIFSFTEVINYVLFRVYIENGFPATLKTQVYFRNLSGGVYDSIFVNGPEIVDAAKVDESGKLQEIVVLSEDILKEGDAIEPLQDIRSIVIKVLAYDLSPSFALDENLEEYFINVEIGLQASIEKEKK